MSNLLKNIIVKLFNTDHVFLGVGFLISESVVCTCEHVVSDEHILVKFAFRGNSQVDSIFAELVKRDNELDVSLYRLEVAQIINVKFYSSSEIWGHMYRAFGTPINYEFGIWVKGVIRDRNTDGLIQIEDESQNGYLIEKGFSGTPVWNDTLGGVVGMIIAADPSVRAAYFLPIETIFQTAERHTKNKFIIKKKGVFEKKSRRIAGLLPRSPGRIFKDRVESIISLLDSLSSTLNNLVFILGRGGSGKTALLSHILEQIELDDFGILHNEKLISFDSILYLGKNNISFDRLLSLMIKGFPGNSVKEYANQDIPIKEKVSLFLEEIRTEKILICLDNFEEILDIHGYIIDEGIDLIVKSLLTLNCDLCLLISSREMPVLPDILPFPVVINLDGLPTDDAISLMYDLDVSSSLLTDDNQLVELKRLSDKVNGIPQALYRVMSIISNEQTDITVSDLLLSQDLFSGEVTDNLIAEAYKNLDGNTLLSLCVLAIMNYPVSINVIKFLIQDYIVLPEKKLREIFKKLLRMQLVRFDKKDATYDLHSLDRMYLINNINKIKDFSLTQADLEFQAAKYYNSIEKSPNDWITIEDIYPNLRKIEHLLSAKKFSEASDALELIDMDYLQKWGYVDYSIRFREKLEAAELSKHARTKNLIKLGDNYRRQGRLKLSLEKNEIALSLALELQEIANVAICYQNIAKIYISLGDSSKAIEHYNISLEIAKKIGNKNIISVCIGGMAALNDELGNIYDAIDGYKQALALSEEIKNETLMQMWLSSLGQALANIGLGELALQYNYKALAISEKLDIRRGKAARLWSIGEAYVVMENFDEAIDAYRNSINMANEINHFPIMDQSIYDLSRVWIRISDLEGAEKNLRSLVGQTRDVHPSVQLRAETSLATVLAYNKSNLYNLESIRLWKNSIDQATILVQSSPHLYWPYYYRAISRIALNEITGIQDLIDGTTRFRHYIDLKALEAEIMLLDKIGSSLAKKALDIILPILPLRYPND